MRGAPLALALAAGMVAAVNPCGFSLLPAYIASFIRSGDANASLERRVGRALASATAMTAGFVAVFTLMGTALGQAADGVREQLPWITLAVGVLIVIMGGAALAGHTFTLALPGLTRGLRGSGFVSMVCYGAIYATASLSCTVGPFIAITATASDRSTAAGIATYATYALGMGIIILLIATTAAMSMSGPTRGLRLASRYSSRFGGAIMVLGGLYAIWYARWELRVYRGNLRTDMIIERGEQFRTTIVQVVEALGAVRLAALTTIAIGTILVVAWLRTPTGIRK